MAFRVWNSDNVMFRWGWDEALREPASPEPPVPYDSPKEVEGSEATVIEIAGAVRAGQ